MRYLLLAFFVTFFCSRGVRAQNGRRQPHARTTSEQMDTIRQEYAAIDSRGKRFEIRRRESDEGNSVMIYTGYYEKAVPRKVTVSLSGERDMYVTHFYFRDSHVFFVYRVTTYFKSLADNTGVRSEERFYFVGDKLIRHLGDKNVVRPVDDTTARDTIKELSALQQEALRILKNNKV